MIRLPVSDDPCHATRHATRTRHTLHFVFEAW